MIIKNWIAVNTQWQSTRTMRKRNILQNHQKTRSWAPTIVRKRAIKGWNWTQRTFSCRCFYTSIFKICNNNNFEDLDLDTNPLYLALAEKKLTDCIRPGVKPEWERVRSRDCDDSSTNDALWNFSTDFVPRKTRKMKRKNPVSSKNKSGVRNCCVFPVNFVAATILSLTIWKSETEQSFQKIPLKLIGNQIFNLSTSRKLLKYIYCCWTILYSTFFTFFKNIIFHIFTKIFLKNLHGDSYLLFYLKYNNS